MSEVRVNQGAIDRLFKSPAGPTGILLSNTGRKVESNAKRDAPVDTGRLRSSIQTSPPSLKGGSLHVRVGSNVNYALFVEQGTRYVRARPFLSTALRR